MTNDISNQPRILRLPAVEAAIGCKKSFIYAAIQRGEFPRPVSLSSKAKGWLASEVQSWIMNRAALRDGSLP